MQALNLYTDTLIEISTNIFNKMTDINKKYWLTMLGEM